jgi:stage V sporulation protein B
VNASSQASATTEDGTRAAGRGGIAVLAAKVFFLITGFVQQPLLRRAVGLNDFGALAQALALANTVNNVVVSTGTQGVSRVVAGSPGHERRALRAVLRVHGVAAVVIAGAMAAAAPLYGRFERANDVVAPLLVLALVALLYGVYAPLIGYLNGRRRFGRQAALDIAFATLRTVGLVVLGRLFVTRGLSGALGTTFGWVAAAVLIVPLAFRSIAEDRPDAAANQAPAISSRAYLTMLLPIAGAQLCTNLLLQVDIFLLGRFLSDGAAAAGLADEAQRAAVTPWMAVYKECQTFAFLPYQLLFSVTLVLFPMLARAHAMGDREAVRAYVARGARLAAILAGLLVAVIVAMPESMLAFAYGATDAAQGAPVLRAMALAQGAFTMLGIATTVLTSTGRERTAALVTLAAVIAVACACTALVPGASIGAAQLVRSAQATGIALVVTLLVAGAIVRAKTGAFVPLATGVRVVLAVGACLGLGCAMPRVGQLATPLVAAMVGVLYAGILVVTRELRAADFAMVRALGAKRSARVG